MFEDKKWSDALKKAVEVFFAKRKPLAELPVTVAEFVGLIDQALEEGRQEVLDDPRKFDLHSEDEVHDREPQRDESRD